MFLKRTTVIQPGTNVDLEEIALKAVLKELKKSNKPICYQFVEGTPYSYDGNPKHCIFISFAVIYNYCKEHGLEYVPGICPETGLDMCIVYDKESK